MAVFWAVATGLMMEAAETSESLVNLYQTTRRCNPEDGHLQLLKTLEVFTAVKTSVLVPRVVKPRTATPTFRKNTMFPSSGLKMETN
jgi:hypothetical protein